MEKEPFIFSTIEGENGKKLDEMFGNSPSCIKVQPGNCILTPKFVLYAQKIRDMKVYEDDIWMVSHPRTGKCSRRSIVVNKLNFFFSFLMQY